VRDEGGCCCTVLVGVLRNRVCVMVMCSNAVFAPWVAVFDFVSWSRRTDARC
jgi:hypothetical protein